jgi:hypothetical protein
LRRAFLRARCGVTLDQIRNSHTAMFFAAGRAQRAICLRCAAIFTRLATEIEYIFASVVYLFYKGAAAVSRMRLIRARIFGRLFHRGIANLRDRRICIE